MRATEFTVGMLRNKSNLDDSLFLNLYSRLISGAGEPLVEDDRRYLLKIAVIFLSAKSIETRQLGYRIILAYSNRYEHYQPLHDTAHLLEYIPVVHYIDSKYVPIDIKKNISDLMLESYKDNFLFSEDSIIYRSAGQMRLDNFVTHNNNAIVVAPTSYGKSDLIIEKVISNIDKNICIVVPSKALLAQTRANLFKRPEITSVRPKIISHPDMYRIDDTILAVLTQERLLRIMQRHPELKLDMVIVDEAHNLLPSDHRSKLLAQVLLIAEKRNSNVELSFFTPFVADASSIELIHQDYERPFLNVDESMKVERFYYADIDASGESSRLTLYDQFLNRPIGSVRVEQSTDVDFVVSHADLKNIVYVNKQRDAERYAIRIANSLGSINLTDPFIDEISTALSDLIHEDYSMIACLNKGVVFHHGGLPDIIRLYIEDIYSKSESIKHIVTTSTLLEGVNIPATRMFLLTPNKGTGYLTKSQFRNLIGRVARFGDIFNITRGGLSLLEPHIYIVNGSLSRDKFSPLKFLKDRASITTKVEDKIQNPLLKNTVNVSERHDALQYLENIEAGSSKLDTAIIAQTMIGKSCFKNNVYDFDVLRSEDQLQRNLGSYTESNPELINDSGDLVKAIFTIFFTDVTLLTGSENFERIRDNEKAQNFYALFVSWRAQGAHYKKMITHFLRYWSELPSTYVYIGQRWGEEIYGSGVLSLWVDMSKKTAAQKVNLAIAKIKEEQDFVDYNLLQYVEVLNDLSLVTEDFYDTVKYGTSNQQMITLLKNGCSIELASLIVENDSYWQIITSNSVDGEVIFSQNLLDLMQENNENPILRFEVKSYIS